MMIMTAPNYGKARAEARRILQENGIVRPPVSPREIAQSYSVGVTIVDLPTDLNDVAGFIDLSDRKIFVNSADHYNRQTFTIAHELGHFFLHKEIYEADPERYKVLLRMPAGRDQSDPLEKEANAFAADLLVPLEMLDTYRKYATEQDLSDMFAVSKDVIRFRLQFANKTYS